MLAKSRRWRATLFPALSEADGQALPQTARISFR